MTLLISALTRREIFQSADYRLTNLDKGGIPTDASSKLIVLQYENWHGSIAYTGIGRSARKDTAEYLKEWLQNFPASDPNEMAEKISSSGSLWLEKIRTKHDHDKRHTFVLNAFKDMIPQIWVISNFEDCFGFQSDIQKSLKISTRRWRGSPIIIVNGARPAVSRQLRQTLKALLNVAHDEPNRVRQMLVDINKTAAQSKAAQSTVSSTCSVVSFRVDGRGAIYPEGDVELHNIVSGIATPGRAELSKLLGFDVGKIVGATFATSRPRVPFKVCSPVIAAVNRPTHLLEEIKHPELTSLGTISVSETSWIAGTAIANLNPADIRIWKKQVGEPLQWSQFYGKPYAITDLGVVVGQARADDGSERAIKWSGTEALDLGIVKGRDSGATAVNADGRFVGWVCIDPLARGQINFRPAMADDNMTELEHAGYDWGMAVDINDQGLILGVGYWGWKCSAIIWRADGSVLRVFDQRGVYPTSINSNGVILGTANDRQGMAVAFQASLTDNWRPIGLDPGFYPTAMNDIGDIVGACKRDGFEQPWLRETTGEIVWLPYYRHHECRPQGINNSKMIVGAATSDHGAHALVWHPI